MNFFLDENIPKPAIQILESRGHKVFDIRSTKHEGSDDITIFKMAQEKESIFVTTDRDFFHTIPHQFKNYFGIIVIILRQPHRRNIMEKLLFALNKLDLTKIKSKVILLKDNDYSLFKIKYFARPDRKSICGRIFFRTGVKSRRNHKSGIVVNYNQLGKSDKRC